MHKFILAIVTQYNNEKQEASKKKKYMKRAVLKTLIIEAKKEFGLNKSIEINAETICT